MRTDLQHLAHALSHASEQRKLAEKAGRIDEAKDWQATHRALTKAAVAIGDVRYAQVLRDKAAAPK